MSTTDEIMNLADMYASKFHPLDIREARAALLKAVESLAADAERVDFVQATGKSRVLCLGSTWYSRVDYEHPITKHKSLRDAIDSAMKETS